MPFTIGVIVGGITYYFICKNQNAAPPNNLADKLITNLQALIKINNFQSIASDDTVSGHLGLGNLLAYIAAVKTRCEDIGFAFSGLQYYFAKYSNDPNSGDRPTIVIYPTFHDGQDEDGNDLHVPFDPFISENGNAITVVDMKRQFDEDSNKRREMDNAMYTSRNVLNRSNMSPPNPPLTL